MPAFLFDMGGESPNPPRHPYRVLRDWVKENVFHEKLNTPWGYLGFSLAGLLVAWVMGRYGKEAAIWLLAVAILVPTLVGTVFHLRFGIWVFSGLVFTLPLVNRFLGEDLPSGLLIDMSLAGLLFGLFLRQIRQRDWRPVYAPASLMIFVWAAYCLLELVNPDAPSAEAWLYAVRATGGWMWVFFPIVFAIRNIREAGSLLAFWIVLGLCGAVYGIWQEWAGLSEGEWAWAMASFDRFEELYLDDDFRKFSFLADPAVFGVLMSALTLPCLMLMLGSWVSRFWRVIFGLAAAVLVAAMIFSGTRTAFVALPVAYGLLMLISLRPRVWLVGLAGLGLLAVLVFVSWDNPHFQRMQSAFRPQEAISFQTRLDNQAYVQPLVRSHPIGMGLGSTGYWGQRFAPYTLLSQFPPDSGFVRLAVETGWVGLGLYLALIFTILMQGVVGYFRSKDRRVRTFYLALLGMVLVFVMANYTQDILLTLPAGPLFFMAGGLLLRMRQLDKLPTARARQEALHPLAS